MEKNRGEVNGVCQIGVLMDRIIFDFICDPIRDPYSYMKIFVFIFGIFFYG
jgi:hypothetical protein